MSWYPNAPNAKGTNPTDSEVPQGNQDGALSDAEEQEIWKQELGISQDTEGVKALSSKADNRCVFCDRIAKGEYDDRYAEHVWFEPLNPVTPGHMLVVPVNHLANLNDNTGDSKHDVSQTGWALRYFTNDLGQYNIITSKGENATQTIQHLHFHIVPRRKGDGLHLPWTGQVPVITAAYPKPIDFDEHRKNASGGGSQDSIDREAIQTLVVTAIADGIDAYEETGTFPPILGNRATDEILELVTAWHNTQLKAELQKIPNFEVKDEPGNAARYIVNRIKELSAKTEQD